MRYTIGQLAEIIDGDRGVNYPKMNEFHEEGFCLFLNTSNVTKDGFAFEDKQFITEEKDGILRKGHLNRGDIVFTTRGTVGNVALYSRSIPFENVRINSGMVILRCRNSIVDTRFIYHLLKSKKCRTYIKSFCTGSAQPQLPIKNLSTISFEIPVLQKQNKIAGIISAYDDLIETNQRQIKLLEEAAQRLYKEWFVDLRYSGHENVPVVDGVPEGWKKRKVTDLIKIQYGKDHKALEDGDIPVYGSGGIMRKAKPILYSGESVLIPRKGSLNNILYVNGDFWTIDTMFYSVPLIKNIAKYCYLFLSRLDMYSYNIGAAVPSMTVKILDGIDILLPDDETLILFEKQVRIFFDGIDVLKKQNEIAGESRDRLLPKLMSGEIAV